MDLSQSDWKYVDERAGAFVGREWVFAQVRSFLSGPPGTFLLRGDPGTGKTAVAARLAQASCGRLDAADSPPPPVGERTISAGVATAALVEGVKFLYQRAAEVLSAWRARRRTRPSSTRSGCTGGDVDGGCGDRRGST